MSEKYKIKDKDKAYFVTLTVIKWLDIFISHDYNEIILESLKYCQHYKGLSIFAWVLMPDHMHMVVRADGEYTLSEILRDFKKYTTKRIIKQLKQEPENMMDYIPVNKNVLLNEFEKAGRNLKRIKKYKFWQDGNHPKEIITNHFLNEKVNYIHMNPVEGMLVSNPEDYLYSSARNYADLDYLIDIELIDKQLITYN